MKFKRLEKHKLFDILLYSSIIIAGIITDQLTKLLAVNFLKGEKSVPVINGVLQWTYVENRGAAFGMLSENRWIFMSISSIAIISMLIYLFAASNKGRLFFVAIAVIISGGIGNMIDRVRLGYVVDFIDFCLIDFAVFNVADSFVCVGAGLLILAVLIEAVGEYKETRKKQ